MTFETSDYARSGGFYSIRNRGYIQWLIGRQARGMTPWYASAGRDCGGWAFSIHVPGLVFSGYWGIARVIDATPKATKWIFDNGVAVSVEVPPERNCHATWDDCGDCGETIFRDGTCRCNPHPDDVAAGLD